MGEWAGPKPPLPHPFTELHPHWPPSFTGSRCPPSSAHLCFKSFSGAELEISCERLKLICYKFYSHFLYYIKPRIFLCGTVRAQLCFRPPSPQRRRCLPARPSGVWGVAFSKTRGERVHGWNRTTQATQSAHRLGSQTSPGILKLSFKPAREQVLWITKLLVPLETRPF